VSEAYSIDALLSDFGQQSFSLVDLTLAIYDLLAKLVDLDVSILELIH
jgi:hypothetical protein